MKKSITKNRKAFHDYFIEERVEAGISLMGSEVKILRMGQGSIAEGYAIIRDGQAWLLNVYIPQLPHASYMNHAERRDRRLLLKHNEIKRLDVATRQKGYTLIPLEMYFDKNNRVKVEIGLARGKAQHDKRESIKQKDMLREAQKAMKR